MMKRNKSNKEKDDDFDKLSDEYLLKDDIDDLSDDFDDFPEDDDYSDVIDKEKKNAKKKEYYVNGNDLINEIRKYQESKRNSEDNLGEISEELRNNDIEDLHKILFAS